MRDTLDAISHTARALALDTAGLDDKFRVPRGHSDQRLLNAAHAFAQDAQPLSAAFVAHKLPATFLTDLNADIEEFEQANQHHSAGREAQGAARAALEAALAAGLTAVYRLDAIVPNTLRHDPAALGAWSQLRRVRLLVDVAILETREAVRFEQLLRRRKTFAAGASVRRDPGDSRARAARPRALNNRGASSRREVACQDEIQERSYAAPV